MREWRGLKIPKAHSYTATHCFVSLRYTAIPTIYRNYLPKFFTKTWTYSLYRGRDREKVKEKERERSERGRKGEEVGR